MVWNANSWSLVGGVVVVGSGFGLERFGVAAGSQVFGFRARAFGFRVRGVGSRGRGVGVRVTLNETWRNRRQNRSTTSTLFVNHIHPSRGPNKQPAPNQGCLSVGVPRKVQAAANAEKVPLPPLSGEKQPSLLRYRVHLKPLLPQVNPSAPGVHVWLSASHGSVRPSVPENRSHPTTIARNASID